MNSKKYPVFVTTIFVASAIALSACAGETNYPVSAYMDHPIGDAIVSYMQGKDGSYIFPDPDIGTALTQLGVEVVSEETLREKLGDEADALFNEPCTYLYTEQTVPMQNGLSVSSPIVFVISAADNRRFIESFRRSEILGGSRWESFFICIYEILSWQFLPSEKNNGYDLVALSELVFADIFCTEHYFSSPGQTAATQSKYTFAQFAPYFETATKYESEYGDELPDDLRLKEVTIDIGGVEIGTVPLSRGRE